MKRLYNKKRRLVQEINEIGYLLDEAIEERFGFHYSQTDNDSIIDTLDYGSDDLDYKDFVKLMNEYKKK